MNYQQVKEYNYLFKSGADAMGGTKTAFLSVTGEI